MDADQRREQLRVKIERTEQELLRWERARVALDDAGAPQWRETCESQVVHLQQRLSALRAGHVRQRDQLEFDLGELEGER